jgi:exodeoxyribonuclease VII small subunit
MEMTFEEAFKALENIVCDLEEGELSLDESLKRFEEGIALLRLCRKELDGAERKVQLLLRGEDGQLATEPFTLGLVEED